MSSHLPYSLAMVLLGREIDFKCIHQDWLDTNALMIRGLSQRIDCLYSEDRLLGVWEDRIRALGPLFANVDSELLCQVLGIEQWRNRLRLKKWVGEHRYHAFEAKYFQLDSWVPQQPTRVELYTTRGGKWPEERSDVSGVYGRLPTEVQKIRDELPVIEIGTTIENLVASVST